MNKIINKFNLGITNTQMVLEDCGKRTLVLIFIVMLTLSLGAVIYFIARPQVVLLEALNYHSSYRISVNKNLQWFLGSLPSMLHVYAFSILSALILKEKTKRNIRMVVIFWLMTNLVFEFGQLANLKDFLIDHEAGGIFALFIRYFLYGTFDWIDVVFSVLGGMMAYSTLERMKL